MIVYCRFLESIRQLHSKEELAAIDKMARDFLAGEGPKLQRYAMISGNEKYCSSNLLYGK